MAKRYSVGGIVARMGVAATQVSEPCENCGLADRVKELPGKWRSPKPERDCSWQVCPTIMPRAPPDHKILTWIKSRHTMKIFLDTRFEVAICSDVNGRTVRLLSPQTLPHLHYRTDQPAGGSRPVSGRGWNLGKQRIPPGMTNHIIKEYSA